jgi:anaerobic dimethyl sulfoxide reductase subunit B (iron-sulfur subunit)
VYVCPTGALAKKDDGFIELDVEKCINCGTCKDVCPFDCIVELPDSFHSKCDGCYDEVAKGWEPTCVRACLMRALTFKPLDEVDLVTYRIEEDSGNRGIRPSVIYIRNRVKVNII